MCHGSEDKRDCPNRVRLHACHLASLEFGCGRRRGSAAVDCESSLTGAGFEVVGGEDRHPGFWGRRVEGVASDCDFRQIAGFDVSVKEPCEKELQQSTARTDGSATE